MSNPDDYLNKYFPVLDRGAVALVDYMGGDSSIEQAARVSYGSGTRSVRKTRGLIRYLMRHRHCYRGDMQVLTLMGWKRWDRCNDREVFLVPDPETRQLIRQECIVRKFDVDEKLITYENQRMSFAVTRDHRMWFKGKYSGDFSFDLAGEMSHWGHFDPKMGYALYDYTDVRCIEHQFVGFFLGDGSSASPNRLSFHLNKQRKKDYLRYLLRYLELPYSEKKTDRGIIFWVETPDFIDEHLLDIDAKTSNKAYDLTRLDFMGPKEVSGLLHGLLQSDGSFNKDRLNQTAFSSTSEDLVNLVEILGSILGFDSHRVKTTDNDDSNRLPLHQVNLYGTEGTTTLESRENYWSEESYNGKVYCASTQTGLLMVRGGPDKFGFVCGNSTPFEMVVLKFHISMPIFVARQHVRHRASSMNEYSGRYSLMPEAYYVPKESRYGAQSKANRQGTDQDAEVEFSYEQFTRKIHSSSSNLFRDYHLYTEGDVARELARINLPLNTYTEFYWQTNLRMLFHYLALRMDPHAQWEIRQYANVMAGIVASVTPLAFEAFLDYSLHCCTFSTAELLALRDIAQGGRVNEEELRDSGMSNREIEEFKSNLFGEYEPTTIDDYLLDPDDALTPEQARTRLHGED